MEEREEEAEENPKMEEKEEEAEENAEIEEKEEEAKTEEQKNIIMFSRIFLFL